MSTAPVPSPAPAPAAATAPARGTLYLVPAPLDFGCDAQVPLQGSLPEATLATAARLTHWICENAKSARAYLKRIDALHPLAAPLQQQQITELPREVHKKGDHGGKGSAPFDARPLLAAAVAGHDMGLVSEAGMPAVADPSSSVVRAAHELSIPVVPLVGPVSLLLALAASASYIAVPAVLREAIPEASPSLYFGMSLGLTFPFNILLGIPLYVGVAQAVLG